MTRVATQENEDYLLQIAHHGTATHVERLVHEGGYGVRVSGLQQFEFARPDGRVIEVTPKNSAESFRDTDIETLNRENGLDIDAKSCVFPRHGARMNHAMAVEELLHRDHALELDPKTGHYPAHFPPAREQSTRVRTIKRHTSATAVTMRPSASPHHKPGAP